MRTLIVDDEPLARAALMELCRHRLDLGELDTVDSGTAALKAIRSNRPDLLLLDVELRDMTGFDVLQSLGEQSSPAVIMVTAHEAHAVHAFEISAIDYLTKPVSAARFDTAINRVQERRQAVEAGALRNDIIAAIQHASTHSDAHSSGKRRLIGERAHRLHFLALESIDYIEADGNYVNIHVGDQKYTSRDSVKRLAAELKREGFERIRRDTLINLGRVAFAEKLSQAALVFTLPCGTRLVSRTGYRLELAATLKRVSGDGFSSDGCDSLEHGELPHRTVHPHLKAVGR